MADVTWSNTFNSVPTGTDLISEGDDRILDLKNTVRGELRVEHDVGDATVDNDYLDTGRHSSGSARVFFTPAATVPTDLLKPTTVGIWPPTIPELDRLGSSDLDNGRLWVDFDDVQPYVREEQLTPVLNWTDLNTNYTPAGSAAWLSLWPRSQTILKRATTANDSPAGDDAFETIDGMTQAVTIPDDGRSYELVVTATVKWCHDGSRSSAFQLRETTAPTVLDISLVKTNGGDEAGTETLIHVDNTDVAGTLTLTNGTTYTFDVEMCTQTAADLDVNPTQAGAGGWSEGNGEFAGLASLSFLCIELRPYYTTATY